MSFESVKAILDTRAYSSLIGLEEDAKDIFGRRIASTYIAIQVTIRNLNQDNEFLLHDIQVAVDTDLFLNTRDRRLARGVAEIGQAMNPRNQTMRYFEGAASALSAAALPLSSIAFSQATQGFTTFIPVLKNIFPDFSIAQLGRLDDLGFTSGSLTYVIPKSGSHAMVAFIPEKVFRTRLVPPKKDSTSNNKREYKNFKNYNTDDLQAFQNSLEILIAGAHVKEVSAVVPDASSLTCDAPTGTSASDTVKCLLTGKNLQVVKSVVKSVNLTFKSDSTAGSAKSIKFDVNKTDTTKADVVFSAQDFATLKKGQTYIIVLTTQDDTVVNTSATFTPGQDPDASGLTCDKPSGATVTCHLVGKNLKSVTTLKLTPPTGSAISSTKFEPDSADDTKGTATFSATDFATLKAGEKYTLVLVSAGKDIKTTAEFPPTAATGQVPDATSLSCTVPKNQTANVTCQLLGKNLNLVKQLNLMPKSGKQVSSAKFEPNATDHTKATATFSGKNFSSLTKGQSYAITLVPETGQAIRTSATYTP